MSKPIKPDSIPDNSAGDPLFTVIDTETGEEPEIASLGWDLGLCGCDMEGYAVTQDGILLICDECGSFSYLNQDRFKIVYRNADDAKGV